MSAGFGWSISDVVLLIRFTKKVVHALKKNGASAEYQRATSSLLSFQLVLEEVRRLVTDEEPAFRNAIRGQLDESTCSIKDFINILEKKYGRELNGKRTLSNFGGIYKKLGWSFETAKQLLEFRRHLSEQLETVSVLMNSRILWVKIASSI